MGFEIGSTKEDYLSQPAVNFMQKNNLSIGLLGSGTCVYADSIVSGISTYYKGSISLKKYTNKYIKTKEFINYASLDILIFNWNEYAFLFRLFLRNNPGFKVKTVLYSGILCSDIYNYRSIASTGIFDYLILPNDNNSDDWGKVIQGVYNEQAEALPCFRPIVYLRYKWKNVRFPSASHFQLYVSNYRCKTWGEIPESELDENKVWKFFENYWMEETDKPKGLIDPDHPEDFLKSIRHKLIEVYLKLPVSLKVPVIVFLILLFLFLLLFNNIDKIGTFIKLIWK